MQEYPYSDARNFEEDEEIDLIPLFKAIVKNLPLILLVTLLAGALTFGFLKLFVTPMYRTSFTVYVNNKADSSGSTSLSSSDISAARSLASTYSEILTGRTVLEDAAERCGMESLKYNELKALVEAEASSSSELITVYVKGTSPENALYLARAVAQAASGHISTVIDGTSMRVVDEPYKPEGIYSPKFLKYSFIAAVLGCLLACGVIVVAELMDDSLKDEKTLEERFNLSVLGFIPDFEAAQKSARRGNGYYGYESAGKEKA